MFSPPKLLAIMMLTAVSGALLSQDANAQGQSRYEARLQAMQNARQRAQQNTLRITDENVQPTTYQEYLDPPSPPMDNATRIVPQQAPMRMARQQPTRVPSRYTPKHLRTAQAVEGQIIDGGAPIVSDAPAVTTTPSVAAPVTSSVCQNCTNGCSSCNGTGTVYHGVVGEVVGDAGCGVGCGGCGSCGLDFPCSERGGCPPGTWENCWIGQLGVILRNAEYSLGATAFKGPAFSAPGQTERASDRHFGMYAGVNLGIPLCKLSCGLLSGQIGVRTVQSDFNGSIHSPNGLDQTFVTAGLFRRVDYGFQAGFAFDWLSEDWLSEETEVSQYRIDLGWAYPNGTTFGFRSAFGSESDITDGVLNGSAFNGLVTSTLDQYRFYCRRDCSWGGFTEAIIGWTDDSRTIVGFNCDMPVYDRLAVQTGLIYAIADEVENVGGVDSDSWNLFMGFSFRPRGLSWYKYYDRPMFDVADNGTMLLTR